MNVQLPSKEEIARYMEESRAEYDYWTAHIAELRKEYSGQFVAVHCGQVVASATGLLELLEILRQQGIDQRAVWAEYVWPEDERFVL